MICITCLIPVLYGLLSYLNVHSDLKQATRRGGDNRGSRYTGESDTTEA